MPATSVDTNHQTMPQVENADPEIIAGEDEVGPKHLGHLVPALDNDLGFTKFLEGAKNEGGWSDTDVAAATGGGFDGGSLVGAELVVV